MQMIGRQNPGLPAWGPCPRHVPVGNCEHAPGMLQSPTPHPTRAAPTPAPGYLTLHLNRLPAQDSAEVDTAWLSAVASPQPL